MTSPEPTVLDARAADRMVRLGGLDLLDQRMALREEGGPQRIAAAEAAAAAGALPAVQRAAHSLKSSAGNLGLSALQQQAHEVESAAGAGERAAVLAGVARLEPLFASGLNALRSLRSSMREDDGD
ncbi:MAG TPA: Hpt domain-containing protein [Longimicrobiales bacterium]|nr:Hpt domain-containing protein [Longimicrobiales bacterium]